mmetsp:Transcript_56871/g.144192  ORF Transcript_56871/g.144192 Transcript_56871/m.144192 type:complete len:233 (+) Transcript_56871:280-978(+)
MGSPLPLQLLLRQPVLVDRPLQTEFRLFSLCCFRGRLLVCAEGLVQSFLSGLEFLPRGHVIRVNGRGCLRQPLTGVCDCALGRLQSGARPGEFVLGVSELVSGPLVVIALAHQLHTRGVHCPSRPRQLADDGHGHAVALACLPHPAFVQVTDVRETAVAVELPLAAGDGPLVFALPSAPLTDEVARSCHRRLATAGDGDAAEVVRMHIVATDHVPQARVHAPSIDVDHHGVI